MLLIFHFFKEKLGLIYNNDMDLKEIFDKQILLDKKIVENLNKSDTNNFELKRCIALLIELSEFANEVQTFKYWKKHKEINRQKILEEYVDGIHFLTSLSKDKISPIIIPTVKYNDFNLQLAYTFKLFTKLLNKQSPRIIKKSFSAYLGLGKILKISYQELIDSYYKKNEINFNRIKNNY